MEDCNVVFCEKHPEETVVSFCNDCDILVCKECITDEQHERHKFVKLYKAACEKRTELTNMIENNKDDIMENLRHRVSELKESRETHSKLEHDTVAAMRDRADVMKSHIDHIRDAGISKFREVIDSMKSPMTQIEKEANETIEHINKLSEEKENWIEKSDAQIIQVQTSLKQKLDKIFEYNIIPTDSIPSFIVGEDFEEKLEKLYGSLENENEMASDFKELTEHENVDENNSVEPIRNIECISLTIKSELYDWTCPQITDIYLTDDSLGWLLTSESCLYSFSLKESKPKLVCSKVLSGALTQKGELLIATEGSRVIQMVNKEGKSVYWCDMGPNYYPKCLCVTQEDTVIVCMFANYKEERNYITLKFDIFGKLLCELFPISSNKNVLLIKENANTDLCVIEKTPKLNLLAVYGVNGVRKFSFRGVVGPNPSDNFNATSVCCDSKSGIIVPDYKNHMVYHLDSKGIFVKYLVNPGEINTPKCVAIDRKGQLLIGAGSSKLYILRHWDNDN